MTTRYGNTPIIGEFTNGFEQPAVGRAFQEGEASVSGVYYDLGFIAEMIYVDNLGSNDIKLAFKNSVDQQPGVPPLGKTHAKVKSGTIRVFRKRKEELVLLQSVSGTSDFILEAW